MRSFCSNHYRRFLRYGEPTAGRVPDGQRLAEIHAAIATVTDDCIEWQGATSKGYGLISHQGKNVTASRVALQLFTGQDGRGLHACHGPCHNTLCINVRAGHVYWGTVADNKNDRRRDGTSDDGEAHSNSKLKAEQVRWLRSRAAEGATHQSLADTLDISRRHITDIINRNRWSWLE